MIKTIYDNRRIISVIRKKVKPVSPSSCFFLEQEKSNPVVKQVYVTKSGSLKIVDAGMLVMNWVSKKEFGDMALALFEASLLRHGKNANKVIIEEIVTYKDGQIRTNILHSWKKEHGIGMHSYWTKNEKPYKDV